MAAIVIGSMLLLLVALSSGSWAHASFVAGEPGRTDLGDVPDEQRLELDLAPTGRVRVERGDEQLAEQYDAAGNASQRAVLRSAVPGTLRDLVQVVAVLVIVVAAVGAMRPLTQPTWVLIAAGALSCLVATVILRDQVISALAANAATMELGAYETGATGASALAVVAAGAGTVVAALASGPRPMRGAPATHPLAAPTATEASEGAPAPAGAAGARRGLRPRRPRRIRPQADPSLSAPE